jgi:retron-type reverse transcriptase
MKKHKDIQKKRKSLETFYTNTFFKRLKTIQNIGYKSITTQEATFDNLMFLISDTGILFQAMGNISGKEGALTPGTILDQRTVDSTSIKTIDTISNQLKDGTFRFKPIRRIYMDKSGKNPTDVNQILKLNRLHRLGKVSMDQIKEIKARPLGISSFPDKIVQEAIRIILNAIYEPEFQRINSNFGFRPGKGCQDAISQITTYAKSMDFAIEGDIKGAFDNVSHEILINILRKKIKDEKFLKLIKGGLKCGIMYLNYREDSNIGTTQGSVVSPLLYNIYFHEFDKFINTEFTSMVDKINIDENRSTRPVNKLYNSYSKKKTKLKLKQILLEVKEYKTKFGVDDNLILLNNKLKKVLQEYESIDKQQKKLPAFAKSRQLIRFFYIRYADDWVFFTNSSLERVIEWKELFTDWIRDKLQLSVSNEKTKLTHIKKGGTVRFLGYQLKKYGSEKISRVNQFKKIRLDIVNRTKFTLTKEIGDKIVYKSRTTNPSLVVSWDAERIIPRLINSNFIKKVGNTYRGKSKLPWTILSEPEIIQRYNYIIRGYINYYTPVVNYPTGIQFLHYLLTYSCAHTLAQKRNTTIRKIFKKFGKNLKVSYIEKTTRTDNVGNVINTKKKHAIQLLDWKNVLVIIKDILLKTRRKQKARNQSISITSKLVDEICNIKINWRTKYKLSQHCSICGSEEDIEYHHVKHIKVGKVSGFLQIMKQLNRKQIPCCRFCHRNIHNGNYNSISLNDLYDEELIII